MRKTLLIGLVSTLFVASVAFAATGGRPRAANFGQAVKRTERASSLRYTIEIQVLRALRPPIVLHVHGVSAAGELYVTVQTGDVTLSDGTKAPGPEATALVDGPFLYERAPNGLSIGAIKWLRVPIAKLGTSSPVLAAVHAMTPAPILQVLGESHATATSGSARAFHGPVSYDDPIVRTALTHMSGGVEFRHLVVSADVGADGLVHTLGVTGSTADGSTLLHVRAQLYAFGQPVHLTPPAEGTFMDQALVQLAE